MHIFEFKNKSYNCPSSWAEVTTDQFQKIVDLEFNKPDATMVEILSILSGIPYLELRDAKFTLFDKNADGLFSIISWYYSSPDWQNLKVPKSVMYNDIFIRVPKGIESLTYGQHEFLKKLTANELSNTGRLGNCIDKVIAILFYDKLGYDLDDYENNLDKAGSFPILDTYPIANFFLSPLVDSMLNGANASNTTHQPKRYRQVWESLTNLVRFRR